MSSAVMFPATAMPDPEWWHALWPEPEYLVGALGISSQLRVVDLCCGDGLFTAPLCAMASWVYAIDIDTEMIDRARSTVLPSIRRLMFVRHETEVPGDHKI